MKHIKKILLDLDGPLLDGKERHYHCYRGILQNMGFKPIGIEEYWETKRAMVNRRVLLNMSGAGSIYKDFLVAWMLVIESPEVLALDRVQEGAVECLRNWKEQGMELTLVTMRKNKDGLNEQLNLTGLRQYLDGVLVSDHADGGLGKAEAVRRCFRDSSDQAFEKNALWIGDTEADWQAAKSIGCSVVLVSNGLRDEKYLKSLGGALVEPSIASLRDVEMAKWGS